MNFAEKALNQITDNLKKLSKKLKESGRKTAYFKAAMSGNERRENGSLIPGDALFVKEMSGIEQSLEEMCPGNFQQEP